MHADHKPTEMNCAGCPIQDCPAGDSADDSLPFGRRLVLASVGLFLCPAVLAIAGAVCFRESCAAQLSGAVAGLAVGMAGAVGLAKRFPPSNNDESTTTGNA